MIERISADSLALVRRRQLVAERADLEARLALVALKEELLAIEERYKLVGEDADLDTQTGEIRRKGDGKEKGIISTAGSQDSPSESASN